MSALPELQTPATPGVFNGFYNENSHRAYPFVSVNAVPTQLIIGMGIIATSELPDNSTAQGSTYISKIVTDGVQIQIYMAMDKGNTTTNFGCVATIDVSEDTGVRTNINYVGNEVVFEGFIITGDTRAALKMAPVTPLGATLGKIHTTCIYHMNNWVAGIRVGDKVYSGIVTLKAGAGVDISVDNNIITLSCKGAIPPDNSQITNDYELLKQITDTYGAPITTVNGHPCGGDWNIITRDSDGLSVTADNITKSITITNSSAEACCSKEDISYLVTNIAALNERMGVLQSFHTQLETNLNILSAQVARFI